MPTPPFVETKPTILRTIAVFAEVIFISFTSKLNVLTASCISKAELIMIVLTFRAGEKVYSHLICITWIPFIWAFKMSSSICAAYSSVLGKLGQSTTRATMCCCWVTIMSRAELGLEIPIGLTLISFSLIFFSASATCSGEAKINTGIGDFCVSLFLKNTAHLFMPTNLFKISDIALLKSAYCASFCCMKTGKEKFALPASVAFIFTAGTSGTVTYGAK